MADGMEAVNQKSGALNTLNLGHQGKISNLGLFTCWIDGIDVIRLMDIAA